MRRFAHLRCLLRPLLLPAAITSLGFGVQAAAFQRPTPDSLIAAAAVARLLRYDVMRGTEDVAGRRASTLCLQGEFQAPRHRHPVRGSLVLLGHERLYDLGHGVRHVDGRRPAGATDRIRFLLAGCPWFVGDLLASSLVHRAPIDADWGRADRRRALLVTFGYRRASVSLAVDAGTYRPIALRFTGRRLRGWSDLEPGEGAAALSRVRTGSRRSRRRLPAHA